MVINTRHIGFVVDDLERFIDFYQGLGLKLISRKLESGEYIERLVGLKNTSHSRLVLVGRLKQKGLAHDAYYSMGKNYYWVKRGNTV